MKISCEIIVFIKICHVSETLSMAIDFPLYLNKFSFSNNWILPFYVCKQTYFYWYWFWNYDYSVKFCCIWARILAFGFDLSLKNTAKRNMSSAVFASSMCESLNGCTFCTKLWDFGPLPQLPYTFKALY